MEKNPYKHYMVKVDSSGATIDGAVIKDLEVDFDGLRYCKAENINTIGKARVYTEEYVDSDTLRVYVPDEITNEATTINLTLYFIGANRYATYDAFNEYIREGFTKYWDTSRNKEFVFFIEGEITIGDERWYGDKPYLQVTYALRNIKGKTETHS